MTIEQIIVYVYLYIGVFVALQILSENTYMESLWEDFKYFWKDLSFWITVFALIVGWVVFFYIYLQDEQ